MLLSRSATVVLLAFITLLSPQIPSRPSTQGSMEQSAEEIALLDTRPANCRVTLPSDSVFEPPSPVSPSKTPDRFFFGTEGLWTMLPRNGTWRGPVPSKPGDFVYDDKLPWYRNQPAFSEKDDPLTVRGKRLDGPAPSFIETYEVDDSAMTMGGISIPVFGCWEITGHYKDQELTFTIWVTSLPGQEPSSRASSPAISSVLPARTAVARRIHLDPETQARSLVYRVVPEIPPAAQAANISGTVVLHAIIGTDGRAHELSYISGPRLLVQAAIEAVVWWRYSIAVVSREIDEPEEVDTTVAVLFPPQAD
jgi:TonB-like protein